MTKQNPDEATRSVPDPDADRGPDTTDNDPEEWTGGHQEQGLPRQDAGGSELPDLEEEEDSVVRPENS
jgi:hypothetical protein